MHRPLRWFIPPLLGIGGYLIAARFSPTDQKPPASSASPSAASTNPRYIKDFKEELKRLNDESHREGEYETRPPDTSYLSKLDEAQLRSRVGELTKRLQAKEQQTDVGRFIDQEIWTALRVLAERDGKGTLDWINEHLPFLRGGLMDAWGSADPEAALQAVIASKRKPPCSYQTLSRLLQFRAELGPSALRQACDQVPWELFYLSGSFGDEHISIPDSADLKPWIESGAAEELARKGVPIGNLFTVWVRHDPAQAVARMADWPGSDETRGHCVRQLFDPSVAEDNTREQIARALEQLPKEQLREISRIAMEFLPAQVYRDVYPALHRVNEVQGKQD